MVAKSRVRKWLHLFSVNPHLPSCQWRSSRSNNSATQATIYKRICVCESPRDKLCHKQKIRSFRILPSIWIFRLGRWTGLLTLDFATTFLSIHYDYRHKWYSIWKPVNRAFRHVKYRSKTRPGCWVMDSWVPHWKQEKVRKKPVTSEILVSFISLSIYTQITRKYHHNKAYLIENTFKPVNGVKY